MEIIIKPTAIHLRSRVVALLNHFILSFFLSLAACSGDGENPRRMPVYISQSVIPPDGESGQDIQIQLKADASGCFSELKIELKEIDSRHFLLEASGRYNSNGKCPAVVVTEDTVIAFRPAYAGEYYFHINGAPFEVQSYRVVVQ